MATTEDLFISVSPQSYLQNKSAILLSQTELLRTLKHLKHLKVLSRKKNSLKLRFHKLLTTLIKEINSLQKKMPTSQIPKAISKHKVKTLDSTFETKKVPLKRDAIEEELILIQEKLKRLNKY